MPTKPTPPRLAQRRLLDTLRGYESDIESRQRQLKQIQAELKELDQIVGDLRKLIERTEKGGAIVPGIVVTARASERFPGVPAKTAGRRTTHKRGYVSVLEGIIKEKPGQTVPEVLTEALKRLGLGKEDRDRLANNLWFLRKRSGRLTERHGRLYPLAVSAQEALAV